MKITWDRVQTWANDEDWVVYAMDQGQTPVLADINPGKEEESAPGPWGVASDGFCVGLAMRWIGLRYKGQDYPYNPRTRVANGEFWEATRDQNISRSTPGPWPSRFRTVMGQYGAPVDLKRCAEKRVPVSAKLLTEAIAAGDGLYYFELRREGGAHALAIESEGGRYHLFDSNEGHFLVKSLDRFQ